MFSYKEFAKRAYEYLQHIEITSKNAESVAEILFYILQEQEFKNFKNSYSNDLRIKKTSIFESKNFKNFFVKSVKKEILKYFKEDKDILINKLKNRAIFSIKEVFSQKKAMIENRSRSSDIDLILAVFDIASEKEISQMYVTVSSLKNKLDEATYRKLREFARRKSGSCRVEAKYFLYILKQIEEFEEFKENIENKEVKEQQNVKIENKKETKEQKVKKIDKNTPIYTSETDFKKRKKGEKLDKETRYKLYLYRQKYEDELRNARLTRLSKDDLLFFFINTEKLVENQAQTLERILKVVKYADSNPSVRNPIGWLISRFMISRGRFYFLLSKPKQLHKHEQVEKEHPKSNSVEQEKRSNSRSNSKSKENFKDIYINGDLAYFIQKYNIPENEVLSYLSKFEVLHGDVSYIVERYVANKIWKNLSKEERQKLIIYAQREIKRFAVPPKSKEELQEEIKSIIFARIKSDYLTLSIEERLRLQMSGQYDTS